MAVDIVSKVKLKNRLIRAFKVEGDYRRWVRLWRFRSGLDHGMQQAIGGEFVAFGILERELLIHYGLGENDYLIDIGCGSGRLAKPMAQFLKGRYLGTDVVPDLVRYGQKLADRPDWRFETVSTTIIPERDNQADMVCFFSVFTHLLHEQSYLYLQEARRVLKPGGKIVFSFLEFKIPSHWTVFESTVGAVGSGKPLNVFIDRDAIFSWAAHLDLQIVAIHNGDKPFIPVPYPLTLESGEVIRDLGTLGQSVCVMQKP